MTVTEALLAFTAAAAVLFVPTRINVAAFSLMLAVIHTLLGAGRPCMGRPGHDAPELICVKELPNILCNWTPDRGAHD